MRRRADWLTLFMRIGIIDLVRLNGLNTGKCYVCPDSKIAIKRSNSNNINVSVDKVLTESATNKHAKDICMTPPARGI